MGVMVVEGVGRKWYKLITSHLRNLSEEEENDAFVASSNPKCVIF
jgi:hypothetical protein